MMRLHLNAFLRNERSGSGVENRPSCTSTRRLEISNEDIQHYYVDLYQTVFTATLLRLTQSITSQACAALLQSIFEEKFSEESMHEVSDTIAISLRLYDFF